MPETGLTFHRTPEVLSQKTAQGQVLLRVHDGSYYDLNEVGARIWELCDGTHTIDQIAIVIAEEFEAPIDQIRADVAELLDDLGREGLVEHGLVQHPKS